MTAIYDSIGKNYTATRAADSRITERLKELLGLPVGSKVLDVGAGTGNYSYVLAEAGFHVTALEPSKVMRDQGKQHMRLSWIEGIAEDLPFDSNSFDGVVMTLCIHHFTDWKAALRETARVVGDGPIVILSFNPEYQSEFWLFDYFPSFAEQAQKWFPRVTEMEEFAREQLCRGVQFYRFPLPSDLKDHFAAAGWSRPEIYLDKKYRSGISHFSTTDQEQVTKGLERLSEDLRSGHWDQQYGELRNSMSLDVGFIFLKLQIGEQGGALNAASRRE